jgi:hypothetical protein
VNLSDPVYLVLALLLGVPMITVALLNWLLRNRGGFARGWAGAAFVILCWGAGLALILIKAKS